MPPDLPDTCFLPCGPGQARIPGTDAGAITLLYPTHQFNCWDAGLFVFAGVDFGASKTAVFRTAAVLLDVVAVPPFFGRPSGNERRHRIRLSAIHHSVILRAPARSRSGVLAGASGARPF